MKFKDNLHEISDDRLEWLLTNQQKLDDVKDKIDPNIIERIRKTTGNVEFKKSKKVYFGKTGFIAAASVIFIILAGISFYFVNSGRSQVVCRIENGNGEITINNRTVNFNLEIKPVSKNETIGTGKESGLNLKIGEKSSVFIDELSEVKIVKLEKTKTDTFEEIYLKKGKVECSVTLPTSQSRFSVVTDLCRFTVKGTKFSVAIDENKNVTLQVSEGIVEITELVKYDAELEKIKKSNFDIYSQLKNISDYSLSLTVGESITLKKDMIDSYYKSSKEIINDIYENKNKFNEKDIEVIFDKIKELDSLKEKSTGISIKSENKYSEKNILNEKDDNVNSEKNDPIDKEINPFEVIKKDENKSLEETIIIKRLPLKLQANFSETDTVMTTDGRKNLYISSNSDKSVYCVDLNSSTLKWKFHDKKINNITSPAISYNGEVILATNDMFFSINNEGKTNITRELPDGPIFWAYPVTTNGISLIPGLNTIYKYDGKNLQILSESIKAKGQIYVSSNVDYVYYSALNEKAIGKYDLRTNKIVWKSASLKSRSFMPPLVNNDELFIGDIGGNLYKFNTVTNSVKQIKINSGIVMNMILYENYIYFVSSNGIFYKIETGNFDKIENITAVDTHPNNDKYLVKKMLPSLNRIYYCTDSGKLFVYDIKNSKFGFIYCSDNPENYPFICAPIEIGNRIFILDTESNIYQVTNN